ncbi:MAG: hypothetical protein ACFCU5_08055 [Pleurocapsa sp.]
MSANWLAKQIVNLVQKDIRNIIITVNPISYLVFPIKEFWVSTYFKLFTKASHQKHI